MAVFLFVSPAGVFAAGEPGSQAAQKVRIPRTAEEHRAMAQSYRMKAMNYEREAKEHQLMCEEYQFEISIPKNPPAAGPSLMMAQKHCELYMRDTEDLAKNARELAEYHEAQAKELGGQ